MPAGNFIKHIKMRTNNIAYKQRLHQQASITKQGEKHIKYGVN